MNATATSYATADSALTAVLDALPAGAWGEPSPCEGWTARQVLEHVVEGEHGFLARFDLAPELAGDGPAEQWSAVRDALQAAVDDPATAATEYDGFFGRTTLAETVDDFLSADVAVHTWDIARATGLAQHEAMLPDEVERIGTRLRALGDAVRGPGVFGPEVEVPADASDQDRFLGFIGRHP